MKTSMSAMVMAMVAAITTTVFSAEGERSQSDKINKQENKVIVKDVTQKSGGSLNESSKDKISGTTVILGLTGKVSNEQVAAPAPKIVRPLSESSVPSDIDLKRMAEWALYYLTESPRKHLNYDPVFECHPLRYPPAPKGEDSVVPCDTDVRMELEWYYMRDITGSDRGKAVEAAFHKRIRGYIDEDGFVRSTPGAYYEGNSNKQFNEQEKRLINTWGMAKVLRNLSEDYIRTKNPASKDLARKVMLAAKKIVTWDEKGRCWLPFAWLKPDRTIAISVDPYTVPLAGSLLVYWKATGDSEGLDFAKAFAEGIVDNIMPKGIKYQPNGSFSAHGHLAMHAVWSVAELGDAIKEQRYITFAKRVYDWACTRGPGTGWFPARYAGAPDCSEMCLLSDLMSTAACIAHAGHPEYYDHIERYMRNYVANSQFIANPAFEAKYRELNKALSPENMEQGLKESRKFQGGFWNVGLNDFDNTLLGGFSGYIWKIAGCCAPSGMRAVYTTWMNTIDRLPDSPLGPAGVYVNMSFNRESKWGCVVSFMPDVGRITVKVQAQDAFFVRPPHWAAKKEVLAFVDFHSVPVVWSGAYVRFDAKPGQELTITYPLISFSHQVDVDELWPTIKIMRNVQLTYIWLGNMVTDVLPKPEPGKTPLFTGKIREIPPAPDFD